MPCQISSRSVDISENVGRNPCFTYNRRQPWLRMGMAQLNFLFFSFTYMYLLTYLLTCNIKRAFRAQILGSSFSGIEYSIQYSSTRRTPTGARRMWLTAVMLAMTGRTSAYNSARCRRLMFFRSATHIGRRQFF